MSAVDGGNSPHALPVRIEIRELSTVDVTELALKLLDDQRTCVGVSYGYCVCGAAVSANTARRAAKSGRAPACLTCARARAGSRTKDPTVYLCAVCRAPLDGRRATTARALSKSGHNASCGEPDCKRDLQHRRAADAATRNALPCAVCGRPSTPRSSTQARSRGDTAHCERDACIAELAHLAQAKRLASIIKPREPCAVCGGPAGADSSRRARYMRGSGMDQACPAYCDSHKPGQGRKPGKSSAWAPGGIRRARGAS